MLSIAPSPMRPLHTSMAGVSRVSPVSCSRHVGWCDITIATAGVAASLNVPESQGSAAWWRVESSVRCTLAAWLLRIGHLRAMPLLLPLSSLM